MHRIRHCPGCGVRLIKAGKYCSPVCSMGAVREAVDQLKEKKGPVYDKWKARLKESLKRL
jgi:uncharacterized Zn finger protein (UPF0148 family)